MAVKSIMSALSLLFSLVPVETFAVTLANQNATPAFSDASNGTLTYTVNGVTRTKSITRMVF